MMCVRSVSDDQRFQSAGHFGQLRQLAVEIATTQAPSVTAALKSLPGTHSYTSTLAHRECTPLLL
eukprot:COSAG05_NODE_3094_length_2326_cov_10.375842_3_plen_65_part_00